MMHQLMGDFITTILAEKQDEDNFSQPEINCFLKCIYREILTFVKTHYNTGELLSFVARLPCQDQDSGNTVRTAKTETGQILNP